MTTPDETWRLPDPAGWDTEGIRPLRDEIDRRVQALVTELTDTPSAPGGPVTDKPSILFACVHNSGRSVASAVLARHYAGGAVDVRSAGSEPGTEVNPGVARVLAEVGLPVTDHTPTKLDYDLVDAADVVVTLGCGEACPAVPGTRIDDWPVDDPKGRDVETVRRIVADLDARVRTLLGEVAPGRTLPPSVFDTTATRT